MSFIFSPFMVINKLTISQILLNFFYNSKTLINT